MTYTMTIILTKNVQYAEQFALLQCFDVILVLPPVQNSVTNYSRALSWMPFSAFLCYKFFVLLWPSHVVYPYTNAEMMVPLVY